MRNEAIFPLAFSRPTVYHLTMITIKDFPTRLREAREKRGLTPAELGHLIGKDRSTVSNYERNVGHPPLDVLVVIAKVLRVSVDHLLGHKVDREAQARHRAKKKEQG